MIMLVAVGGLLLLTLVGISYSLYGTTTSAIHQYDDKVKDAASGSLNEIFIFVDEKKIKFISFIAFLILTTVTYLATGWVIVAFGVGLIVFFAPTIGVKMLKKVRFHRFNNDLPDALLSLSNMLKSGLNLPGAIGIVVAETKGPLGQEFGLFLNELTLGVDFSEALDGMYKRIPIPDLELVVAGMKISREVGGSLSEVLARLSDTIRRRMEMEGKIKSLTAMGALQGWVMTFLPIAVGYAIYLIEPETMSMLFTDWRGWVACFVVAALEFIGFKTIQKIVSIDV